MNKRLIYALRYKIADIVRQNATLVGNIDNSVDMFVYNVSKRNIALSDVFIQGFKGHLKQSVKFYIKKVEIDLNDLSLAFKEILCYKIDKKITIQN